MRLRIFRKYSWVLDCNPREVRFGGENPFKLVHYDTLQCLTEKGWENIEIVEDVKPPHPNAKKNKIYSYEDLEKIFGGMWNLRNNGA